MNLLSCYLFATNEQNEEVNIPIEFLIHIANLPRRERWDIPFGAKSAPVNILGIKWIDDDRSKYFFGRMVEVKHLEKLDLIDVDGEEDVIEIPEGKGEKSEFHFIFCPEKKVGLIEAKGRGSEGKLRNYLSRMWEKFQKDKATKLNLWFHILAITVEESARIYLKDKAVSTMKFSVDCSNIEKDSIFFGLTDQLLGAADPEQITMTITLDSSKRNSDLPRIAVSKCVDVIETLENESVLKSAACKEMIGSSKSHRITQLLDIHRRNGVEISKNEDIYQVFQNELGNLIDELKL